MLDHPSTLLLYLTNLGYAAAAAALLYVMRNSMRRFISSWITAKAGPSRASSYDFLTLSFCSGAGVFMALAAIGLNPWVALTGGAIAAFVVPRQLAMLRRAQYQQAFDLSLVESLTTIGSSLRAGLTLKDSLVVAAKNSPTVFADEISVALKEYHFGVPIETALDHIRQRVGTANANITFGAMILGNQLGGNLPATLQRIVTTVRERSRVEGKLKSLTAQGRTQSLLLCSAPPVVGVFMYLWDPAKMALLTGTFTGQVLLTLAVVLEVVGIFITSRIMKLDI